ncbi:MAG: nitroreductase family protein [Bacillota bacterium]|nr:nitroreductase family protein [Bacillota bacterium]
MLKDLVIRNRSCRRFSESEAVDRQTLLNLVDLARLSATGNNDQPLKYILSCQPERNALIFPHVRWARHLKDWAGPQPGERPAAYIVVLGDRQVKESFGCDHGIASQSILLGAAEAGLAGCMIGSVMRDELRTALEIPARYDILLVLALGKPAETIVIEPLPPDGSTGYWRDEHGVHHVPKRPLADLIVG